MKLIASLLTGAFVYLLAGALTGHLPDLTRRLRPTRGQVGRQQLWLIQAGADLTPRQFLAGSVFAGFGTFALLALTTGIVAVAVVPAIIVALLPRAHFARRRAARLRELQETWPDGIRDLLAGISAGLSLNQAIAALAANGPEPLRQAFARYPVLARMLGVVPALEIIKEELADPTSDRILEVLILGHERGGHILPDILRNLADATTKDVRAHEQVETEALEQKINARAVFVLPWLVLVVLSFNQDFAAFYRQGRGFAVVALGALLSLVGMWSVNRLSHDPVEERVFGAAASVPPREEQR